MKKLFTPASFRELAGSVLGKYANVLRTVIGAALIGQSIACGTIMHPERRGQKTTAKLDVGVVILDAVGLLFFLIPGVIAFAVDFSNGTIYLPRGGTGLLNLNDLEKIRFDPDAPARARVERLLQERTGLMIRLDRSDMQVTRLKSVAELSSLLYAGVQQTASSGK